MIRVIIVLLVLVTMTGRAWADAQGIVVDHARAAPALADAASSTVYLTITDNAASDRLLAARTTVAAGVQFRRGGSHLGVAHVGDVKGIDVDKGIPLIFSTDGYSLILTGLAQTLQVGDQFPLVLIFKHAGPVSTTVTVEDTENSQTEIR